jgi:hypothetical protein
MHWFIPEIKIDNTILFLLVIALIPWMPDFINTVKFGEYEIKFDRLKYKVAEQKEELDKQKIMIHEMVIYAMSESIYKHLWEIDYRTSNGGEYLYRENPPFKREMYYLRDNGYIENIKADFIDFDSHMHDKDLTQLVKLTPIGNFIIQMRKEPK